jgi:hypothetical protein
MVTSDATVLPSVALDDATVEAFRASRAVGCCVPATRTTTLPAGSATA